MSVQHVYTTHSIVGVWNFYAVRIPLYSANPELNLAEIGTIPQHIWCCDHAGTCTLLS